MIAGGSKQDLEAGFRSRIQKIPRANYVQAKAYKYHKKYCKKYHKKYHKQYHKQYHKKYSNISGFNGKITPFVLVMMTRMLFKYKKTNAQWIRVATILELIYKYLGNGLSRNNFFINSNSSRVEIPIMALMDLEEFYNTDHIFMSEKELINFKKDLDFYKLSF